MESLTRAATAAAAPLPTEAAHHCPEADNRPGIDVVRAVDPGLDTPAGRLSPLLRRSWRRCRDQHGLEPQSAATSTWLSSLDRGLRLQREADLLDAARDELDALGQSLADEGSIVLLADAEGAILALRPARRPSLLTRDRGFDVGALWSEARRGTNAIGTCIIEGDAVSVSGSDHFLACCRPLSGTAVPIHDDGDRLRAVIAVFAHGPAPEPWVQDLLLATVRRIARRIARPGAGRIGQAAPEHRDRKPDTPVVEHPTELSRIQAQPALARQLALGRRVLARQVPILLHGETGVGKEVFARALHQASPAAAGAFVAINCASLPESLIESELFGYRAGAFTGAQREGRRGRIVQADRGTLFLDEIGDMPLALQARLLRVLEERSVTPLGSESSVSVDFQLLSASHRHLPTLVADGRFREDLYYRLNGVELTLPPLRERRDRRALIRAILAEESRGHPQGLTLTAAAESVLLACPWPGNLRQLRHVLRSACALCDGPGLDVADLPATLRARVTGVSPVEPAAPAAGAGAAAPASGAGPEPGKRLGLTPLEVGQRRAVLDMLETHRWNLSEVARLLGVSRNAVYRKLRRLDISLARSAGSG